MTTEDLQRLKEILLEDKKRIEEELKNLSDTDYGSDVDSGDEESDEAEEMSSNIPISGILEERLKGIDRALEKMEAGTYGVCEKCGKEISMEVLDADPESALCKACKANG